MPQKYKVFFNHNRLLISKKATKKYPIVNTLLNPDKETIGSLVSFLMTDKGQNNYLILTDNLKETWGAFCTLFEIRKAAGGVVLNNAKEKLFIKRKGAWDLPKGHLEKGEKNKEAAIREVQEECGIKNLTIERKIIKTYHTYILKNHFVLKPTMWYLMKYSDSKSPTPQLKEKITETRWIHTNIEKEILNNSYPSIESVNAKLNKILSKK